MVVVQTGNGVLEVWQEKSRRFEEHEEQGEYGEHGVY